MNMHKTVFVAAAAAACATMAMSAQTDWRTYGNDPGHQRFSTLAQITPDNVGQLSKAWQFDTKVRGRKWENTPVVIDGTMYVTLQNGGVVALEPETGRELWRNEIPVRGRSVRAVAYWPGDRDAGARLLYGAGDRLIALDPRTGRPIESFGTNGIVDIRPGGPPLRDNGFGAGFQISSPPAIYKNVAIVGGSQAEGAVVGPAGDPHAFDARTGKLLWRFHTVPQPGERNFSTWGEGWRNRGGPAIWGLMTVDTERGLVFIPTGNPGGSFYGGDRPGDNLYSVSVLALDASTGAY
jgi:quinoprotein glucose dehydrogenase